VAVQLAHTGSGTSPRAVTAGDISGAAAWCSVFCATRSVLCAAGEIVVLRVVGEVDLRTVAVVQAALEQGLAADPAHLLVDLAAMTFCCARGLDLFTQTAHRTAGKATSFAVSGVSPQIARVWTLGWDGDLPSRHYSIATAMTAVLGCQGRLDTAVCPTSSLDHHHWIPGGAP
jgi:anti-sigma B factor antagonist